MVVEHILHQTRQADLKCLWWRAAAAAVPGGLWDCAGRTRQEAATGGGSLGRARRRLGQGAERL